MRVREASVNMTIAGLTTVLAAVIAPGRPAPIEAAGAQAAYRQEAGRPALVDGYQRSADLFTFSSGAKSGPQRGEELYFIKCWFCHNLYTKTGPTLKGLFQKQNLLSGEPVNEQTVAAKTRAGGPLMPAYKYTMSDVDMADLLGYLKSPECCFEAENPPPNPRYKLTGTAPAIQAEQSSLKGGAHGVVQTNAGVPLEGIGVQLVSSRTAIRTTVYTNEDGRYEFPVVEPGSYTLRIAKPLEFKPWVKENVSISGSPALETIALERLSGNTPFLPSTPDVMSQLSGIEWLMNLPGTAQEKKILTTNCTHCHSYPQIFKNRFDEAGWRIIVRRMQRAGGSPLITWNSNAPATADDEVLIKFLARVRGPESKDPPSVMTLPWARGPETRVVITEYELPRTLLAPHDVHGDSQGRIWYTAHRSPYSGVLDPKTGKVTEYRIPATEAEDTPGALPGTHRVWVDKNDIAWYSEQWDHFLTGIDTKTGKIVKRFPFLPEYHLNSSGFSNFAMDENGYAYETNDKKEMIKIDTRTGQIDRFPFPGKMRGVYDSTITPDGRYWVGGEGNIMGVWDTKTRQYREVESRTQWMSFWRGGFDRNNIAWYAGRAGVIVSFDPKTLRLREYFPPIQYATMYEAMPDKNGEIWTAPIHAGRIMRFNPTADKWTTYPLPEPFSHDRRTWIDNSTNPVTVWFVDHNGWIVRVQPLD